MDWCHYCCCSWCRCARSICRNLNDILDLQISRYGINGICLGYQNQMEVCYHRRQLLFFAYHRDTYWYKTTNRPMCGHRYFLVSKYIFAISLLSTSHTKPFGKRSVHSSILLEQPAVAVECVYRCFGVECIHKTGYRTNCRHNSERKEVTMFQCKLEVYKETEIHSYDLFQLIYLLTVLGLFFHSGGKDCISL